MSLNPITDLRGTNKQTMLNNSSKKTLKQNDSLEDLPNWWINYFIEFE